MADDSPARTLENDGMSSVYRFAVELVEETRRANERRLADARDLAEVVRIADDAAASRIVQATQEANDRDLAVAERQAEELVNFARGGILSAVQRYAATLVEEQRRIAESRMPRARQLADLIRAADPDAADRMLKAIEEVHASSLQTAEEQAQVVIELARSRLQGSTPADPTAPPAYQPAQPAAGSQPPDSGAWAPREDDYERRPAPPARETTDIEKSFLDALQRGPAADADSAPQGEHGDGGASG